jgi:transcriptional regulator with XRE-family HTH domain
LSVSEVARRSGVSQSHVSRLLRRTDYKKSPSASLARAVAEAFGLPPDYFSEYREAAVIDEIKKNHRLRDTLYDELRLGGNRRR